MMALSAMSIFASASLSEQECRDLGFSKSQLSCESCDVLNEKIGDDTLDSECRSCCTEKGSVSVRFLNV